MPCDTMYRSRKGVLKLSLSEWLITKIEHAELTTVTTNLPLSAWFASSYRTGSAFSGVFVVNIELVLILALILVGFPSMKHLATGKAGL